MCADEVAAVVGAINADRAVSVLRTYVNAYFDQHLRHHHSRLLDGPSPRYPDIRFVP